MSVVRSHEEQCGVAYGLRADLSLAHLSLRHRGERGDILHISELGSVAHSREGKQSCARRRRIRGKTGIGVAG